VLDAAGLDHVRIFASGGLDEEVIDDLVTQGAPIDAFGVGTRMDVSADAPYLDMAYKLVRYDGRNVLKTSPGKETWTGEKQVYRFRGPDGRLRHDVLALRDEPPPPDAEPLLQTVMTGGHPAPGACPPLAEIRRYCAAQVAGLPDAVVRLRAPAPYPVHYSDRLLAAQRALKAEIAGGGAPAAR
jgi:nicotinate phosphoribosyltransferase